MVAAIALNRGRDIAATRRLIERTHRGRPRTPRGRRRPAEGAPTRRDSASTSRLSSRERRVQVVLCVRADERRDDASDDAAGRLVGRVERDVRAVAVRTHDPVADDLDAVDVAEGDLARTVVLGDLDRPVQPLPRGLDRDVEPRADARAARRIGELVADHPPHVAHGVLPVVDEVEDLPPVDASMRICDTDLGHVSQAILSAPAKERRDGRRSAEALGGSGQGQVGRGDHGLRRATSAERSTALDTIFEGMKAALNPEKAQDCVVGYEIADNGTTHSYTVTVQGQARRPSRNGSRPTRASRSG